MFLFIITPILILAVSVVAYAYYLLKIKTKKVVEFYKAQGAGLKKNKIHDNYVEGKVKDDFGQMKYRMANGYMDFKFSVGPYPGSAYLTLFDPKMIKEVLMNHTLYDKANKNSELSMYINGFGLTKVNGDMWKKHRKLLSTAFHFEFFENMIPKIQDVTSEILNINSKKDILVKGVDDFEKITSEVIARIFFGLKTSNLQLNNKPLIQEVSEMFISLRLFNQQKINYLTNYRILRFLPGFSAVKKRLVLFRTFFKQKIAEKMEDLQKNPPKTRSNDLLQIFLEDRAKNNHDYSQSFTDDEILDEFVTFFVAGKDTTSILVTMCLYCMTEYPAWNKKIREEVENLYKNNNKLTQENLNKLEMMDAFIKEVLRVYPPAPGTLLREALSDHKLSDVNILKGTILIPMFIANNFSPSYFSDPLEFKPERWYEEKYSKDGWKDEPYAYLPFSAGPRNCIGKHLALLEAKTILTVLIHHYDISIQEGYSLYMTTGQGGLGYHPSKPIPFVFKYKL